MLIIPAIDVHKGQCVRLRQGQFDAATTYPLPPLELAKHYAALGASRLHVVDLDGAKGGEIQQLSLIQSMLSKTMPIQVGGGIRSIATARICLEAGLSNLVIGSMAISNPALTLELIAEVGPASIILALDVNMEGKVPRPAIHGWQTTTQKSAWDVVQFYQDAGLSRVLFTDIAQDGMMQGPNCSLYEEAVRRFPTIAWQASGGVRGIHDIRALSRLGVSAVILGRVLYQPDFNLSACLQEFALC